MSNSVDRTQSDGLVSAFGGVAPEIERVHVDHISQLYREKCGIDVSRHFLGLDTVSLNRCGITGMLFWSPATVAGDEEFYVDLSGRWGKYYQVDRWEHVIALRHMRHAERVLEVGCGPGYFLKKLETREGRVAMGLELNAESIRRNVSKYEIHRKLIEEFSQEQSDRFDAVCSFQVLEHVHDPYSFVLGCVGCLKPGGLLILSTPNFEHVPFQRREDPFDLPPHHMNHFTPDVFRSIGKVVGLKCLGVFVQPRPAVLFPVTRRTELQLRYKILRFVARRSLDLAYRLTGEPGPNLVAVFSTPVNPAV